MRLHVGEIPIRSWVLRAVLWIFGPWTIGAILAAIVPSKSTLPHGIDGVSRVIGWTYFMAWSFSFYPQILYNYRRKSVAGLSVDFQVLNLLGFIALSLYYGSMLFSSSIRKAYKDAHDGHEPSVHSNDLGFSLNATMATLITLSQCLIYGSRENRPSNATVRGVAVTVAVTAFWASAIALSPEQPAHDGQILKYIMSPLTLIYFISYIKLGISLVKYIPQVIFNWQRKSTKGWNIWQVWLDFEGGLLSLGQLFLDAAVCSDWTPITGNPVKFGLGFVSMFFDVIFMAQHYWLYPKSRLITAQEAMRRDLEASETEDEDGYAPILSDAIS